MVRWMSDNTFIVYPTNFFWDGVLKVFACPSLKSHALRVMARFEPGGERCILIGSVILFMQIEIEQYACKHQGCARLVDLSIKRCYPRLSAPDILVS